MTKPKVVSVPSPTTIQGTNFVITKKSSPREGEMKMSDSKFHVSNAEEMYSALAKFKAQFPKNTLFYSWRKDGFFENGDWKDVSENGWDIMRACTEFLNGLVDQVPMILRQEFYYSADRNLVMVDTCPTTMFENETGFSYYAFHSMFEDWEHSRDYYDDFSASKDFRDELRALVERKQIQIKRELQVMVGSSIGTVFSKVGFKVQFEDKGSGQIQTLLKS